MDLVTGKPVVVKLLFTQEEYQRVALQAEVYAVNVLHLNSPSVPLVPTKVLHARFVNALQLTE